MNPALLDSLDGIAYLVDADGRIAAYGATRWNRFAGDNGAPEWCEPDRVLGLPLLDIVQGEDVRAAYRGLMDELMDDGENGARDGFAFGFRCDAPEIARHMRMAVTRVPRADGTPGLLFQSIVLRTEVRPPLDIFNFRSLSAALHADNGREIVTLCSYCQKVKAPPRLAGAAHAAGIAPDARGDRWLAPEDYYRLGGESDVLVSHGMCGACHQAFWARDDDVGRSD